MAKNTLKNNNRGGKNKTIKIKKIKGGDDISTELLKNIYFITNHDLIKDELLKLKITESNETRENISNSVTSTNCRGEIGMDSILKQNILKEDNTVIYVHNTVDLLGILCFYPLSIDIPIYRSIQIEVICTSKNAQPLIGQNLITILKQFAIGYKAKYISLHSLTDASDKFYIRNGFTKENGRGNTYSIRFNGGKYNKNSKKKTKKLTRNENQIQKRKSYKP